MVLCTSCDVQGMHQVYGFSLGLLSDLKHRGNPCNLVMDIMIPLTLYLLSCVSNFVTDLNRVGAQWRWQEQRAKCSYAGPSGVQRPSPHTAVHGAHPQGTTLNVLFSILSQNQ